jgi:hypothetical protein
MRRVRRWVAIAIASLLLPVACIAAGINVPAGASMHVGDARLGFAGGDLQVAGAVTLAAGRLDGLGHVRVPAGGQLALGGGTVSLAGDWENRGAVDAGSALVAFLDGSGDSAILGETVFADLQVETTAGRRIRLESGATQQVAGALVLRGAGAPLRIDSTTPGATAFLSLLASGSQDIANVAVWDVHATGQWLAAGQENQGGNTNTTGWFGVAGGTPPPPPVPAPQVIPATSPWALLALAAGMLLWMRRQLRRTTLPRGN